jgi:hypothetical protein
VGKTWFERVGDAIGRQAAAEVDYDGIIRSAMADKFEELAREPRYSHVAERLRRMATFVRTSRT